MSNLLACLISELFIHTFCVSTKYELCQQKATWDMANEVCNVPSVINLNSEKEELLTSKRVPDNEPVWTSIQVMASDWAKFHGCFDINLEISNSSNLAKILNETYFRKNTDTSLHVTVQYCSFYCTGRGKHFVYVMNICKCLNKIEEYKYGFHERPICLQACVNTKNNEVFCSSGIGLAVFEFNKDNQKGNWTTAVNSCIKHNSSIVSDRLSEDNVWLNDFLLLSAAIDERNRKCVAMSIRLDNDDKRTLSYQYRNCSDQLRFLCIDKASMARKCILASVNETVTITTHVNTMYADLRDVTTYGRTYQHNQHITTVGSQSSIGTSKTLIKFANIVLFVLLLIVICLIIFSRRVKIALRQWRNQPDPDTVIHSNTDTESSRQIHLRESYADPWDMRHNIAEMEGIYHDVSDSIAAEYSESKV